MFVDRGSVRVRNTQEFKTRIICELSAVRGYTGRMYTDTYPFSQG